MPVALAAAARGRGRVAHHVVWLGRAADVDPASLRHVLAQDVVVVTNNAADFLALYRALDLHPGLVILWPSVPRATQVALFVRALAAIERTPDVVNTLVKVNIAGVVTLTAFAA